MPRRMGAVTSQTHPAIWTIHDQTVPTALFSASTAGAPTFFQTSERKPPTAESACLMAPATGPAMLLANSTTVEAAWPSDSHPPDTRPARPLTAPPTTSPSISSMARTRPSFLTLATRPPRRPSKPAVMRSVRNDPIPRRNLSRPGASDSTWSRRKSVVASHAWPAAVVIPPHASAAPCLASLHASPALEVTDPHAADASSRRPRCTAGAPALRASMGVGGAREEGAAAPCDDGAAPCWTTWVSSCARSRRPPRDEGSNDPGEKTMWFWCVKARASRSRAARANEPPVWTRTAPKSTPNRPSKPARSKRGSGAPAPESDWRTWSSCSPGGPRPGGRVAESVSIRGPASVASRWTADRSSSHAHWRCRRMRGRRDPHERWTEAACRTGAITPRCVSVDDGLSAVTRSATRSASRSSGSCG